jgi:uncharacterized membrane protein
VPDIGVFHPQIVHFVIALGLLGIALRVISLLGRGAWLNPAAAALLIVAAGAGAAAVKSGDDAHGPAERIPGARELVKEHEELGERTRNLLLGLSGLELLGLFLASRRSGRLVRVLSAGVGLVAGFTIYHTAEHGGEIVYQHAGGVGTRSGNPADVENLMIAALFHNARLARDSGRAEDAARLTEELARLRPNDPTVQFLAVESKLRDRHDAEGALTALAGIQVPEDDARLAPRHGLLTAQALVALGRADSARTILTSLGQRFPANQGIKDALAKLP